MDTGAAFPEVVTREIGTFRRAMGVLEVVYRYHLLLTSVSSELSERRGVQTVGYGGPRYWLGSPFKVGNQVRVKTIAREETVGRVLPRQILSW